MLAVEHCLGRDNSVSVVGGGYYYGVNTLHELSVIEHLAEVPEACCFREFVEHALSVVPVYVAKCHDVFRALYCIDVGVTHTADTYGSDVELVRWGNVSEAFAQNRTWSDGEAGNGGCS